MEKGRVRKWQRKRRGRGIWTEEGKREFEKKCGVREGGEEQLEKEWEELKNRMITAFEKVGEERGNKDRRSWWDEECKEKKRKMRRWRK